MAKKIVKEDELFHQGKTLSQWYKAFNGFFSYEQLTKMIRGGCDLEKILMLGLDEEDDECDGKHCSKRLDEVADPENVITVKDFIEIMIKRVKQTDTIFFKSGKTMFEIQDIYSKGGIAILDLIQSKPGHEISNLDIYTVKDFIVRLKTYTDMSDKIMFRNRSDKTEMSFFDLYSKRGVAMFEFAEGKTYDKMNEDDECCCQAKDLKWHAVKDVCPDCKMADDWRCGPAAKKFCDLLYPTRKYKPGTLVMRNKAVKAGAESGEKIIAVPSYFYAIQTNDIDALNLLEALGISLDLAF